MSSESIRRYVSERLASVYVPTPFPLSYGTAGFRCLSPKLNGIAVRVGVLAALRSLLMKGSFIGVMITASHNPPHDNGIKLVDPSGGMLDSAWEPKVIDFMRCTAENLTKWMEDQLKDMDASSYIPHVLVGYDTRESSPCLANEVILGVEMMQGSCVQLGLITTPQLHFGVQLLNKHDVTWPIPDVISLLDDRYTKHFATRFLSGLAALGPGTAIELNVDCANGVGCVALKKLTDALSDRCEAVQFRLLLHNTSVDKKELLNHECGADFVKLTQSAPKLTQSNTPHALCPSSRWATIDGDADRLLYFYPSPSQEEPSIVLLDGDRIACLFASFISRLLKTTSSNLSVGVVQTAYANASSTLYLQRELGVQVCCVPTGVKHLHRAAHHYDFGIYFEANGHGTVLYSPAAMQFISTLDPVHPLAIFVSLTNTAIGDAITDILMVEFVLTWQKWSLVDWANLYTELPYQQIKVSVMDPTHIKTFDAERRVSHPKELQDIIDQLVTDVEVHTGKPGYSRAFVRPSGTENIARVYAESVSADCASWLAQRVALATFNLAGGTGTPPSDPGPLQ